jgi:hypothetical protein
MCLAYVLRLHQGEKFLNTRALTADIHARKGRLIYGTKVSHADARLG